MRQILWEYRLTFSGYVEAPPSVAEARRILADDMRAHPEKYISGLRPIEPTDHMLVDIGKRVLGLK